MPETFTINPRVDATPAATLELVDDAVVNGVAVEHQALPSVDAEFVEILGSRLTGTSLAHGHLRKIVMTDVELATCDLAVLRVEDSSWTRVRVTDSRLSGLQMTGATCQLVEIIGGLATESLWRFATLRTTRFRDCALTGADFTGATLDQVEFLDCDLTRADFSQVRVKSARFVDCTLTDVVGIDSLRGADIVFSSALDALGLVGPMASALGIRISEDPGVRA